MEKWDEQRQLHLFSYPFYYIEYGIAQLGALQLWLQYQKNPQTALDNYARSMRLGGSRPLPELFEAGEMAFDLGSTTVEGLIDAVRTELDGVARLIGKLRRHRKWMGRTQCRRGHRA